MVKALPIATFASLLALSAGFAATASAADLKVVASFSIIADLAKNVGGDRVAITMLVPTDGDAHVYEPTPADAVSLGKADVVLTNGLGLEGFMNRLIETSGTKAPVVVVSKGVKPQKPAEGAHEEEASGNDASHGEHHGAFDPHAWQSIANGEIYVKNIAKAFCKADKAGCATFEANSKAYLAKLVELDKQVKADIGAIPADKRVIITSHDAFGYFSHAYGVTFIAPEGVSTEAEASAADVAKLVEQVKADKASAIFVENVTNPRLIEQIARETGLKVGGTLYSDALSAKDGPASTYIDMFHHNVETMKAAILGS